jgi:tetratricopeptide (TPR) repeat protein
VRRGLEYLARPRPEDQTEAARLLRKALRLGPDRADAHVGLARVFLYLYALGLDESPETLASALSEARKAVELAPGDPDAAAALALSLAAGDRLTPALEEARRAVSIDSASAVSQVALCVVLRLRKDEQGALDACRRAAEIAPHDPRVLSALGDALREARLYDQAMEMFGQAIELDHEAIAPQLGAAATLQREGNYPTARKLYDLLLRKWDYGENRTRMGAAAALLSAQQYGEALELYEKIEVPEGASMPALLQLYGKGYCLKRLGRDAEAEYFFSSVLDRVPPDYDGPARGREVLFDAYEDLVAYFRSKGRDRKVISLLRSACGRPLVPTRLARALAEQIEARKDEGEPAAVLEKAILGADPLEDPLEITESTLKLMRLRTSNGARRLPDDSPAARVLSAVSERLQQGAPGAAHYRLARALSLAQRREQAVQRLVQAREAGYLPTDQMAGEPDFARIRQDPGFEALLKPRTP